MGDMNLAKRLILKAKDCGVTLVKFQLYDSIKLYGKYQPQEVSFTQARELFEYGKNRGVEVFFSVFDTERVKWCEKIGVLRYKIACTRKTDELLNAVYGTGKPVIESVEKNTPPKDNISYLYCVPKYPAKLENLKLNEVDFSTMGFSDHTQGIDASMIALSRGAKIIEKHFRLEDNPSSPDYGHSITPQRLKKLVEFERVVKCCL